MWRIFRITAVALTMVLLSGCGDSDVSTVKKGHLDLDKSTTVGNALENYSYIKSPQWSSLEDQQKRKFVQFKAPLDQVKIAKTTQDAAIQKLITDKKSIIHSDQWSIVIQFRMLPNDRFEVSYVGFENNKGENESDMDTLQRMYKNELTFPGSMSQSWTQAAKEVLRAEEARREEAAAKAAGFLALSSSGMNWADASAYCKKQGGRLPRINGSDSWDGKDRDNIKIDGFGRRDAPWPKGLPGDRYWTGTAYTVGQGRSWVVYYGTYGGVHVDYLDQSSADRVVCVP